MKKQKDGYREFRASELFSLPFLTEDAFYALVSQQVKQKMSLTDQLDMPTLLDKTFGENHDEYYAQLASATGLDVRKIQETDEALRETLMQPRDAACEKLKACALRGEKCRIRHDLPLSEEALKRLCQRWNLPAVEIVPGWPEKSGIDISPAQKRFLKKIYGRQNSFISAYEGERFPGLQAIMTMQTRRMKDTGYTALGAYLFSQAMWLAWEVRRHGYDRLIFLARDGYWVKAAFDALNEALHLPVKTEYVRVSRQAVLPLYFEREEDTLSLPVLVNLKAHTPRTLLKLFSPVLPEGALEMAADAGFALDNTLADFEGIGFIGFFREKIFDRQRFEAYRQCARAYWQPFFQGKCATFDVGYNLRSEAMMRRLTGADVTAYVTHVDSDLPFRREVPFETLYQTSPYVSWVAREQFLLENAPSCVGYTPVGVQEGDETPVQPEMAAMQQAAMQFVRDMRDTFGEHLLALHFRPQDGCVAFERLLHTGRTNLAATVENAFHGEEESTALQWRLMQTDFAQARHPLPRTLRRLQRAALRLRKDRKGLLKRARMKRR